MKQHFYACTGKAQEEAKSAYENNQNAKRAYVQAHAVNRSHGGKGMTEEEFEAFTDEWAELSYYKDDGVDKARTKGFHAKSKGLYVFSKIFRFIENDIVGDVHVSDNNWKMNFTMEQKPEEVELDEEDKDATPMAAAKFDAEIRLFAKDPEDAEPEMIYVQIVRKQGDICYFGNFVKDLMNRGELSIFVEPNQEWDRDNEKWKKVDLELIISLRYK